jgi:AraC-like DNA-binding protein
MALILLIRDPSREVGFSTSMVKKRHASPREIVPVPWRPSRPNLPVEVLRLPELASRLVSTGIERLEFHGFVLFTRGTCTHEVDFEAYTCRAGSLVHVRPGQVQRWELHAGVEGFFIIFEPTFLLATRRRGARESETIDELGFDEAAWPVFVELGARDLAAASDWVERLERTLVEADGSPTLRALARHLLFAALIDVARRFPFAIEVPRVPRERAHRLREDVERSFRVTRNVGDYARRWGVSTRTIDRLARDAFGVTLKEAIDARVVLEARRLLAHTGLSVAAIGESLGFSEPTNFGKFFEARTGERPGVFRARQR